ncbi:hypothetical protein CKALI_09900 [Corynebacterium kalinowskii]|uniref:EccD-like transmembrane domain-containing protein n=1 Tax=Corynebacterium kalinowskii TaxID=2675216 RepID=A0A6B8VV88_9CORY|nr:hypothetical protein CKALI_09900 [Corynebacterium kalinowskii]
MRFDVSGSEDARTSVDVCIPASSSFGEAMPEILELAEAPILSVPWQARTAAGQPIDPALPLLHTGISHGDVIVCTPLEESDVSLRKDAAEALSDLPIDFDARGLAAVAGAVGVGCLTLLSARSSLPTVPPAALFLLLLTTVIATTVWLRAIAPNEVIARNVLALCSCALGTATVWTLIVGLELPSDISQRGWVVLAALSGGAGILAALSWIAALHTRVLAAATSCISLIAVGACSLLAVRTISEGAAVVVIAAFIVLLFAPRLSTTLAGLSVPPLPAAGQDLKVSDHTIDRPDERAHRATELLDGICIGTGISAAAALMTLATIGDRPGFTTAFCLAASAACALHAARHRSAPAMWGLWLWTMTGLFSGALVAMSAGTWGVMVALLSGLLALSAPLWAHRVRAFSPTLFHWLERLEALALAAVFPLAAHIAGLFDAIRGLG